MPSDQNDGFLSALANVATQHLVVALPDSPVVSHGPSLLRAIRKRLNMTQREFGILLSPGGVSPISPSVICQLESALQCVPSGVVMRASAVDVAIERFGEHLAGRGNFSNAAQALKSLGPGCIDQLEPYVQTQPPASEGAMVGEFLSIVTKRKPTSGGSRPGARGPYRKLSKVNNFSVDAATAVPFAVADLDPTGESPKVESGTTQPVTPCSLLSSLSLSSASLASTPRSEVSTSSRGSSRPRSPSSDIASEAASLGVDATLLNALKRLQEENEALQNENKRLRSMVSPC